MRAEGAAERLAGDLPLPLPPTCRNPHLSFVQFPAIKNRQGVLLLRPFGEDVLLGERSDDDVLPLDDDFEEDLWEVAEDDDRDRPLSLPLSLYLLKGFRVPNLPVLPRLGVGLLAPPFDLESPLEGLILELSAAGAAGPCMLLLLSSTLASSCLRSMYFLAALRRYAYDLSGVPSSARW